MPGARRGVIRSGTWVRNKAVAIINTSIHRGVTVAMGLALTVSTVLVPVEETVETVQDDQPARHPTEVGC